jgi:hypothetical protein
MEQANNANNNVGLARSSGYRCSACHARADNPHAIGCPEAGLARAAAIAADMLAELDVTKLPLAVAAAIGVLRTTLNTPAAANALGESATLTALRVSEGFVMNAGFIGSPNESTLKVIRDAIAQAEHSATNTAARPPIPLGISSYQAADGTTQSSYSAPATSSAARPSLPALPDPPDGLRLSEWDGSLWAHSGDQLHDYGDKCFRAGMAYARTAEAVQQPGVAQAGASVGGALVAKAESKLAAVWANLQAMIEKHTGQPCIGEPLDALAAILAAPTGALVASAEQIYQVWQFGVGGWRDTSKQEYDDAHPGYRQIVNKTKWVDWEANARCLLDEVIQLRAVIAAAAAGISPTESAAAQGGEA